MVSLEEDLGSLLLRLPRMFLEGGAARVVRRWEGNVLTIAELGGVRASG